MKYLDTKENSIEDSVTRVLMGEKLVGGQKKLDKDKDGDIDGKDFAMLRKAAAKKKDKNEMKLGMPGMSSFDPTLRKRKKDVKEGTWAMPDSPKLKMGLKKALQRPIMLGKEGDDATDTIRSFIGDDELYDDLYAAGMKNPKGDARPIIKKAMKRLGIKEDVELDENFRKLAMKGMGTETKKGARVGLKTDYYLPSNGDKSFGKIMRVSQDGYEIEDEKTKKTYKFKFYDPMKAKQMKENYDIGNDYAKHTLRVTPGQSEDDVDEMLGIMQKKTTSMREALAKVWGLDEGQSPFDEKITRGTGRKGLEKSLDKLYGPKRKDQITRGTGKKGLEKSLDKLYGPRGKPNKEEKDSKKTMMGGKQTPVQVDPKMEK